MWVVQTQTVLKLKISLGAGIASGEVKSGGGVSGVDQSRLSSGIAELALEDDSDSAKTVRGPSGDDAYYESILNSARKVSGGNQ